MYYLSMLLCSLQRQLPNRRPQSPYLVVFLRWENFRISWAPCSSTPPWTRRIRGVPKTTYIVQCLSNNLISGQNVIIVTIMKLRDLHCIRVPKSVSKRGPLTLHIRYCDYFVSPRFDILDGQYILIFAMSRGSLCIRFLLYNISSLG